MCVPVSVSTMHRLGKCSIFGDTDAWECKGAGLGSGRLQTRVDLGIVFKEARREIMRRESFRWTPEGTLAPPDTRQADQEGKLGYSLTLSQNKTNGKKP